MKVLILSADLGGNVPPALAIADALARRGVEVEIAGLVPGSTELEHVPFLPGEAAGPQGQQGLRKTASMYRLFASKRVSAETETLMDARRPDVVLVDCMLIAPLRGALRTGFPVVVMFHTLGEFWSRIDRTVGRVLGLLGFRPHALWAKADERLMLTDADLDRADAGDFPDSIWTGTTEVGVEPSPRRARPRILVALSTTDWPGMLPVYRRIVTALSGLSVDAVVTTGGVDLGGPLAGAANVDVRGWAGHAELLPSMDLVIGHGGHSTTMKVLAHGVPLLVLPINPTSDQRLVGDAVERSGVGRVLPKSTRVSGLRSAVESMLGDGDLRERAATNGRRLRAAPAGAEAAAERIIAVGDARLRP
ncbi:glycosyltransferase [Microbacterium sp. NPDC087665]|uniref:glycosyltransferase n=1 Tax=Microbacterium sp. NPDC087665 TaxID=3364194 RepID=UPI00381BAB44